MQSTAVSAHFLPPICTPGVRGADSAIRQLRRVSGALLAAPVAMSSEPRTLSDIAASGGRYGGCTLGASAAVEAPLPDEGEREQVWVDGYGYADRPAASAADEPQQQSAVA